MTFTDPIGDMFSRIRNGQLRSLNSVVIPSSKFRKNIKIVSVSGGVILLITGMLILTNKLQALGYFILEAIPILGNLG